MNRKHGDRKDATLIRKTDALHLVMPIIYPNRCDNEFFVSEILDLTKTMDYLEKKNAKHPEYKYTIFHIIVAASLKTITLRPKMNYFIANKNMYARNEITASFTIKKQFFDDGEEGITVIHAQQNDTFETIHEKIANVVLKSRSDAKLESTEKALDIFNKLPRWMVKCVGRIFIFLDKHGWVPQSITESDPYYASVILTNLGSLHFPSGKHHLTNWGTTSIFITVGEMKKRPIYQEDGTCNMKYSIDLGLTVDERISDGYYLSKTVKLLNSLIENPELLDLPFSQKRDG